MADNPAPVFYPRGVIPAQGRKVPSHILVPVLESHDKDCPIRHGDIKRLIRSVSDSWY